METQTWEAGPEPELSEAWSAIDSIVASLLPGSRIRVELLNGASEPIISRVARGADFDHPVPEVETVKPKSEKMARREEETPESAEQTAIKVQGSVAETVIARLADMLTTTVQANTDLAKHNSSISAGERDRMGRRREESLVKLGRTEAELVAARAKIQEQDGLIMDISAKLEQISGAEAGSFGKMPWPERWGFLAKVAGDLRGLIKPSEEQISAILDAILKNMINGTPPKQFSQKIKDLSNEDKRKLYNFLKGFVLEHFAEEMMTVEAE